VETRPARRYEIDESRFVVFYIYLAAFNHKDHKDTATQRSLRAAVIKLYSFVFFVCICLAVFVVSVVSTAAAFNRKDHKDTATQR